MSKRVLAAIESAGGEFDEYGSRTELRGTASLPGGTVWNATDCHIIAVSYYSDRPAGWRALARDVAQGTKPCAQDDCDVCRDDAEEAAQ